jgi:DNA-binding CsgD family transcriptional regulator
MGTNHGLFVADIIKTSGSYDFTNIRLIPNSQGQVWTLEKFDNQILCGHNEGTYLVEGNSIRQISNVTGGWTIKQYNDLLIEGTYTGIVVFKKDKQGKWAFRNKVKYFNEPTRHLEIDYLGYIWTSHPPKGIYRLELNETLDSVIRTDFYNIVLNKPLKSDVVKIKNKIAFTTSENIYTFDYDQKKIIPFSSLDATLGDYVQSSSIIHFEKDKYWFVNGHKIGLFEIAKDFSTRKYFELLQKSFDIPERDIQIINLDDKTLLIPTRQAFSLYNLVSGKKDDNISRLQIKELIFQGKIKTLEFSPELTKVLKAPFRNNNLTVYFADPSHFNREEKEFFYKINEIDDNWHRTTLDNFTYLNLKYGMYHLMIKSDTSDKIAETEFVILRPWYLTWPAFGLYFLVLAGLVMLGVRIFHIELKKQRQLIEFEVRSKKLENELDYKSYELMLSMRYLIQKNEILTELQKQIDDIKDNSSKYPIKPMRDMEKIIDEGLKQQTEEWRSAMDNLKLSQQGFFKKLKDKHPDLTPHDLRLCSYLRMNFNTKEIAKLLNITNRGVEISRYRLRRKMNLNHDINLTEYLIGQTIED